VSNLALHTHQHVEGVADEHRNQRAHPDAKRDGWMAFGGESDAERRVGEGGGGGQNIGGGRERERQRLAVFSRSRSSCSIGSPRSIKRRV
jgi:hypothetical protein